MDKNRPKAIQLEDLEPSDIIRVTMDSDRIIYLYYDYPILDADLDYRVALHMADEIDRLEKENGRALGLYVDIDHYNRLDCVDYFGLRFPCEKARKIHSRLFRNSVAERAAYFKKKPSHLAEALLTFAAVYYKFKVRMFGDEKEAVAWLKDGVRLRRSTHHT